MSELAVGQLKGLTVNGNVISIPSGHVLNAPGHITQVVEVAFPTQWFTTSTSYSLATSASITLKKSTSRVFIFGNMHTSGRGSIQLQRGAVVIYDPQINYHYYDQDGSTWNSGTQRGLYPITILDTPGTATPTYNFYARAHDGIGIGFNEGGSGTSKIYLMEVAQ